MNAGKDLIVVVADGALQEVIKTLLTNRCPSLGIRQVSFDIIKDSLHDSSPESCLVELLRGYVRSHNRALAVRDLAGSGWEREGAVVLETNLETALQSNGWAAGQAKAIVLEPEMEIWLRFGSAHMESLIQTRARKTGTSVAAFNGRVAAAITKHGGEHEGKPVNPKEVFEELLMQHGIPRSNALYPYLAERESLAGCQVRSFQKFCAVLRDWFLAR